MKVKNISIVDALSVSFSLKKIHGNELLTTNWKMHAKKRVFAKRLFLINIAIL